MSHQGLLDLLSSDVEDALPENDATKIRVELGLAIRGVGLNKDNGASSRYLDEVTIPSIQAGCKRLVDGAEEKIKETIRRYHEWRLRRPVS